MPSGAADDVELSAFDRTCYEFSVGRGGSFEEARSHCKKHGGDLVHGLKGATSSFLLAELERRKPSLKTQLVWIGAQREPGFTSRTWRWVDGRVPCLCSASISCVCLLISQHTLPVMLRILCPVVTTCTIYLNNKQLYVLQMILTVTALTN